MSRSINQIAFDEGCLMKSFSQTSKINTAVSHMTKARFFWLHFYRRQYGSIIIRLPDVSRGRLKFYPWTFFFLFFFILLHRAQQPRSGWPSNVFRRFGRSLVGKASTVGREISPTPPLIFTGSQKVRNLASFLTSLNLSNTRLKTQQDIRILKQKCNAATMVLCSGQV